MKGLKLFALMLFSISSFATAQTAKQIIGDIKGQVSVDAEGNVTEVNLNIEDSKLKMFLYEQISIWKFSPMKVNGKPVQSNNDFGFELIIYTDKAKNLNQISFDNVFVSPSKLELELHAKYNWYSKRVEPKYPLGPLRQGLEAKLKIAVKVEPDGSVSDAGISTMKLLNPPRQISQPDQRYYVNQFGNSAIQAVKQWHYSKESLVRNDCINGCIAQITVNYEIYDKGWRQYLDMPVAILPWVENDKVKKILDKPESQFVRLKSEVSNQPIDIGG